MRKFIQNTMRNSTLNSLELDNFLPNFFIVNDSDNSRIVLYKGLIYISQKTTPVSRYASTSNNDKDIFTLVIPDLKKCKRGIWVEVDEDNNLIITDNKIAGYSEKDPYQLKVDSWNYPEHLKSRNIKIYVRKSKYNESYELIIVKYVLSTFMSFEEPIFEKKYYVDDITSEETNNFIEEVLKALSNNDL